MAEDLGNDLVLDDPMRAVAVQWHWSYGYSRLLTLPNEVILLISKFKPIPTTLNLEDKVTYGLISIPVSYLDLPDLDSLSVLSPILSKLSSDPVLHRNRLRIVAPSRIQHSLFAEGCHGTLLRPTVPDLVHMNIMRGLGIERRWRMGNYFLSAQVSRLTTLS